MTVSVGLLIPRPDAQAYGPDAVSKLSRPVAEDHSRMPWYKPWGASPRRGHGLRARGRIPTEGLRSKVDS